MMKKAILKICFKPLTLVNKFIRKDAELIFFYTNLGFRDNVRAFYEYLIEQNYNARYQIVVSTNDYEDYAGKAPENVQFVSNNQGIKIFMKAKYAFYCFGKYPIKPSKKQNVVNLWHGTPLKKIGNMEKGYEHIDYNYFSTVITASPIYKPIMAKIFGCTQEQVEVFGYPRNDELFRPDKIWDASIRRNQKVVLWLPTYREYNDDFVISILTKEQLEILNRYLKENNCRLIIKLHPLQKEISEDLKFSYIEFINQEQLNKNNITVYTLLRNADGLITDYSSVYFDYMLLDRPIAFATPDIGEYQNIRGFVFDNPDEYMPGTKIKSLNDVEQFVSDVVLENDVYKEERNKINDKVNFYKDGNNCQRIAQRFLGN